MAATDSACTWSQAKVERQRDSPFQKVIGTAFVKIELHGEVYVKKDYWGYRMLVPILFSLCVKLVTKNSGEVRTLIGTSVRQLGQRGRNTSHSLVDYWWGGSSFGWLYFNGFQWCVHVHVCVCACVCMNSQWWHLLMTIIDSLLGWLCYDTRWLHCLAVVKWWCYTWNSLPDDVRINKLMLCCL